VSAGRVLLLGLDGATYRVLTPAFEAGHMPAFRALLERSAAGILTSTIPPYTPPGWTSIFTGVNPGRHGIFGFTVGNAQRLGGLVRLDRVRVPALWNAANAQGTAVGLFNIPMTYPAPPVEGFAVSGMLTPEGGGRTPESFTHPESIGRALLERAEGYRIDIDVDYDEDWKSTAIEERLSRNLAVKRSALEGLLHDHDVPLLFAVLEAPDRLMHVHYKYIDPGCEHYHQPAAAPIRERVWGFFDEMDAVIADLLAWAGADGWVVTMSDHGFGPKDKVLNVNLALKEWGLLGVSGAGGLGRSAGLRRLARSAKKSIPRKLWRRAKSAAHSSIDWSRTQAFSSPNPQQGVYINLAGREPHGAVPESRYEQVRAEVVERFSALLDPADGRPVVDRVFLREEVMQGDATPEGPDLFPVCRDYTYELSDGLYSPDVLTDYRALPRGFHHRDGIFGIAGPGVEPARDVVASIYDIAPTALYLAGLKVPPVDGSVLTELLPRALVTARPVVVEDMGLPRAGEGAAASPYSEDEAAQIEESLRNLGYL
jgi:predicted AlkP superfamily phosphohydrolase/phosphomutase